MIYSAGNKEYFDLTVRLRHSPETTLIVENSACPVAVDGPEIPMLTRRVQLEGSTI